MGLRFMPNIPQAIPNRGEVDSWSGPRESRGGQEAERGVMLSGVVIESWPNGLPVHVDTLEFLGSFCRLKLKGPEGFSILRADLSLQQVHQLKAAPDVPLTVEFPPDSLRLFPDIQ